MLNLKKLATLVTVLCSVSLASSAFLVPAAHATNGSPNPCYDITDQGTEVPVPGPGGVANSGFLLFDPIGGSPELKYEACVTDPNQAHDGKGIFDVKGWAWDSNLGWVSLFCGDEDTNSLTPYTNLGIKCGDYSYGVKMDGTDQTTGDHSPGRLHGYAYGDNTGWLNFSCIAGKDSLLGTCDTTGLYDYYVEAETVQTACLGDVFSSSPPAGCAPRQTKSTFAFSDNVGWLNLAGVHFPWIELISAKVNVSFEIVLPDSTVLGPTTPTKTLAPIAPVADGSEAYTFRLHVTTLAGTAIDSSNFDTTVNVTWTEDTVDRIQTDGANGDCKLKTDLLDCAVVKPISKADFGLYGSDPADPTYYEASVTSVAPTSGLNGLDKDGNGTVDFSYETFVQPPRTVPANRLTLGDVQVKVVRKDGVCSFGDDTFFKCDPKSVLGSQTHDLEFQPAVEVTKLDAPAPNVFTLNSQYGVANQIDYSTVCRSTITGVCAASIDMEAGVDKPFVLIYTPDSSTPASCADLSTFSLIFNSSGSFLLTPLFAATGSPSTCPLGSAADVGTNAYVFSTIKYTAKNGSYAKDVSYFSNKLPRVLGTLVVNPVAEVRGSVYSTGVTNPLTGKTVRSIGDVSTNILRDTIFRNVSNLIAGLAEPVGKATISDFDSTNGFVVDKPLAVKKLLPDKNGVPRVYYFAGDVTLSAVATLDWKGERTIVVKNGNVFIKSDLYNAVSGSSKPKLGIIVLNDPPGKTTATGNVYIAPNVKNIQANIYADGSVYSYDPAQVVLANGEPRFVGEPERYNALLNQLFLEGSIASQNTVGGASAMPNPILGDGQTADAFEGNYGNNPIGRSRARLYDLNFMRYYGLVLARRGVGDLRYGDCPDQPIDQQDTALCPDVAGYAVGYSIDALHTKAEGGDLILNPGGAPAQGLLVTDMSAVYISFDPPPSTLPGFGVSTGVTETVRPQ